MAADKKVFPPVTIARKISIGARVPESGRNHLQFMWKMFV